MRLAWCFEDERTPAVLGLIEGNAIVPRLWRSSWCGCWQRAAQNAFFKPACFKTSFAVWRDRIFTGTSK